MGIRGILTNYSSVYVALVLSLRLLPNTSYQMSWTPKLPLSGPSLSQLFDHIGLVSKPKLMCQPLKPPHLLRQSVRILFTCTLAVYILSTMKVSALDDSDFFPMKSLMFRQFAHRRPQISPFERPGRDPDRTCGVLLTKRTQRICSLDCPPPGMNHEKKKHHNIG